MESVPGREGGCFPLAPLAARPQEPRFALDPLELIDRRWSPQVLVRLLDGPQRFAHLATEIPGVSRRMLTERLRELQAAGIVVRNVEPGPPASITYALADEAGELLDALRALRGWATTKAS